MRGRPSIESAVGCTSVTSTKGMSRTAWILVSLAVVGVLAIPALRERLHAVRRAVGAVAVYWVSLNLWGTALHFLGLAARPPQGAQIVWVVLPPVLAVVAWLSWDTRSRPRRPSA